MPNKLPCARSVRGELANAFDNEGKGVMGLIRWMAAGTAFALVFGVDSATAVDLVRGKALHDEFCLTCHNSHLYGRANRRMRNRETLRNQVKKCSDEIGEEWTEQQIDDVTAYLNDSFYRFKAE
jgi:mono/diheme cytochrome c family protein